MKKNSRGFTLIELLVVIGIIAVLAAVIVAALAVTRTRGTGAAIRSELSSLRPQAELYRSINNSQYSAATTNSGSQCITGSEVAPFAPGTTSGLYPIVSNLKKKATVTCYATTTAWVVTALGPDGLTYCADSVGNATTTASVSTTDFNCE
jgi:prepilin-type N-terminal cleavage/methylation domain-containing protein